MPDNDCSEQARDSPQFWRACTPTISPYSEYWNYLFDLKRTECRSYQRISLAYSSSIEHPVDHVRQILQTPYSVIFRDLILSWGEGHIKTGKLRSYLDAASFELWLQWVFLPNARAAAEKNDFPKQSQVGTMAMRQYDYHSQNKAAETLLQLLAEFDALVEGRNE